MGRKEAGWSPAHLGCVALGRLLYLSEAMCRKTITRTTMLTVIAVSISTFFFPFKTL